MKIRDSGCFVLSFARSDNVGVSIGLSFIEYKSYPLLMSADDSSFLIDGTAPERSTNDFGSELFRKLSTLVDQFIFGSAANVPIGLSCNRSASGLTKVETPKLFPIPPKLTDGSFPRSSFPRLSVFILRKPGAIDPPPLKDGAVPVVPVVPPVPVPGGVYVPIITGGNSCPPVTGVFGTGQPLFCPTPALFVIIPYAEYSNVINPEFPPFPQDVELPPFAVIVEVVGLPKEFVELIVPPAPPFDDPLPPFETIYPVVDVATVIDPPLLPTPPPLFTPFAISAPTTELLMIIFPAFCPTNAPLTTTLLVVAFCILIFAAVDEAVDVIVIFEISRLCPFPIIPPVTVNPGTKGEMFPFNVVVAADDVTVQLPVTLPVK